MHWSICRPRRHRAQPQSSGPNTRPNHTVEFLCEHGEGRYRCAGHIAGDTARAASTGEVTALRREARDLKEVVAEQTLELRLLKKSMIADGGDVE